MKGSIPMRKAVFFCFSPARLLLTGCAGAFDPYQRPGNWSARGAANEAIAQQANPADLIKGQSESTSSGVAASAGIARALGANGAGTGTGLQLVVAPVAVSTTN